MSGFPPSRYSIAPTHHHQRQSSLTGGPAAPSHPSPALLARIEEKKQELESLLVLRGLSGNLASQMQQLGDKLSTLADGTEAVATVLSNWQTVLRAIATASTAVPRPEKEDDPFTESANTQEDDGFPKNDEGLSMPQTLVRIPIGIQQ